MKSSLLAQPFHAELGRLAADMVSGGGCRPIPTSILAPPSTMQISIKIRRLEISHNSTRDGPAYCSLLPILTNLSHWIKRERTPRLDICHRSFGCFQPGSKK